MPDSERRLAAIMFTDIVGFTSMAQKDEHQALQLLEEHRSRLRPIIAKHRGSEIKTIGDAFLVEFPSALEGVRCAVEIQESFRESDPSPTTGKKVILRIGVHLGDVVRSEGDIYGDAVNVASRIEALAEPGGVCITQQVYDHVRNKVETPMVSIGRHELKNTELPIELYKLIIGRKVEGKVAVPMLDRHRLAVLPFSNISADPNDDYFADGMTEELISTTSAISGLTVIARTSVMRYKGLSKGVSEIGRELNVGSLLEGSVRKAGDRLRITVQLIETQSEGHLWAQSYNREMKDIFSVQEEIAQSVAEALQLRLLEQEKRVIEGRKTDSIDAHDYYLKGRYFWNERTKEGIAKAIRYFELAIEKDPSYSLAYAGLADSYAIMANYGYVPSAEALPKAKGHAIRALELDQSLAEAHSALGMVLWNEWDVKGAGRELRNALLLNPSYASAHQWYGDYLLAVGKDQEAALKEKLRARELDPFSPLINLNVGGAYYYMGKHKESLEEFRKAVETFPDYWNLRMWLAGAYALNGKRDEAFAELQRGLELGKERSQYLNIKGLVHGNLGEKDEAIGVINELTQLSKEMYVAPTEFATIYGAISERDSAFLWLEKAYSEKDPGLLMTLADPVLTERLGADPRWASLRARLGLDA